MPKKIIKFAFEKATKNSVRFKELPEAGQAPVLGTLYVQNWFAGQSKIIEVTIETQ